MHKNHDFSKVFNYSINNFKIINFFISLNAKRALLLISVLSILLFLYLPCHRALGVDKTSQKLIIFCAGSLTIPFHEIEKIFENQYPLVDVQIEPAGSRLCARKITDLKKDCHIMASADNSVITNMLIPDYAEFSIVFAGNEMVLMYNDKSLHSDIINSSNWYEILLKKGVEFGHSDPDADPCGYRTLMTWQLAEKYYNIEGLYKKIQQACPKKNIREKSVDLIALLQTGELDYIYEYKSVAMQHKGKFIYLPDQINLKSQKYSEFYKNAKVKISGKKPGTFTYKTGSPMIYGITILKSAENNKAALDFTKLLFGQKGRKIMEKNGQTSIYPPIIINKEKLPDGLKEI